VPSVPRDGRKGLKMIDKPNRASHKVGDTINGQEVVETGFFGWPPKPYYRLAGDDVAYSATASDDAVCEARINDRP
jgi:hypothetical protein